jgi:hypothetical protein
MFSLNNGQCRRIEAKLLNGIIPTHVGQLTALLYLSLYGNQLKGSLPTQIGRLAQLVSLCGNAIIQL